MHREISGMMKYKDYYGSVEYRVKDDVLYGKVKFVKCLIQYHGISLQEIRRRFQEAVDDYLEQCKRNKVLPEMSFKGSFTVNSRPEIHKRLTCMARDKDLSLNALVNAIIVKYLKENL